MVQASASPNFECARILSPSTLSIPRIRAELTGYHDHMLPDVIEFGFPMSFLDQPLLATRVNHPSAAYHPTAVDTYFIDNETTPRAMIGPLAHGQFLAPVHTSPLMSHPKKSDERRVILDLSWPPGGLVNDGITKGNYMGTPFTLQLPTAQDFTDLIIKNGNGCYVYNADLSRAYRQHPADDLDWPVTA